jgi:ribosome maturation factor RimP
MSDRHSAEEIIARIEDMARPLADQLGLELVEVEYRAGGDFLRIFVDRPGRGASMEDCSRLSRSLSAELDSNDPIPHPYNLEVSSPGLDRPLKGEGDYLRHSGKLARLVLAQPFDGQNVLTGHIGELKNSMVRIALRDGESVWLPLAQIRKGRLEIELKKQTKKGPHTKE